MLTLHPLLKKKKKKSVKTLMPLPPKLLLPITHDSFTAHESPGCGCKSWGWLCAHTCPSTFPAFVVTLWYSCKTELTQESNTNFQLCLRFSLFSRTGHTLCSTKQNCGSKSLYFFLMASRCVGCVVQL